jgi:metal-responsive CopG/Arc/MetJ family transcriptional regulator
MKTAISLPDTLYEDAEKTAKSMGIPRSQLFAKALEEFINHHKRESITEKYNEIYSKITSDDISKIESINIINLRELTKNDTW